MYGLKTSFAVAEQLKVLHATVDLRDVDPDEEIGVSVMGEDAGRTVNRYEVCQIAEARMREIFEMIGMVLEDEAAAMPRAGIILTGGAAQMPGITELGREVLQLPVRVAGPLRVSGLTDTITTPAYSTAVGLLRWGALNVVGDEAARYDTMPGGSVVGRVRDVIRGFFP